jgi:hypothetical protein
MDINALKSLLLEAEKESELAYHNYALQSAVHRASLQIMQYEKDIYYGDSSSSRHLQKLRDIIDVNSEDINNETN